MRRYSIIPRLALLALRRDAAAGELQLLAVALLVAVASMASVAFFVDRVRTTLAEEAHQLLAADVVLTANAAIDARHIGLAEWLGLRTARMATFNTMAVAGEQLELADLKAVDSTYPLRGHLEVAPAAFAEASVYQSGPPSGTVWVESRLLQALAIAVGDHIELGTSAFTIGGVLMLEPDRGSQLFSLAPRILMNYADLEATGLVLPGSRVQYALLLAGSDAQVRAFRAGTTLDPGERLRGVDDVRPELNRALGRAEQFLSLAALTSVLVAGIAIALSARRFATRHFDSCAIMRTFGASQAQIFGIFGLEILVLGIGASLLGAVVGYLTHLLIVNALAGIIAGTLAPPSFAPFQQALLTGTVAILGFALPPLLGLWTVPPARVLRRDMAPRIQGHSLLYLAALAAIIAMAPWGHGSNEATVIALTGALIASLVLAGTAALLVRILRRLRGGFGIAWRYGLASISRHAGASVLQTTAIGLGVMIMLLLAVVRTDLLDTWRDNLPEYAPNHFLINIQPDDVPALRDFLSANGVADPILYPMIRGRLEGINDGIVDPDDYQDPESRRMVQREFNLTWTDRLAADNRIVAGHWLDRDPDAPSQFSLEEGIAQSLGVGLGDRLRFRVADQTVTGTITSLRTVDWDSFNVNFFVIGAPGLLNTLPATYITSFYLNATQRAVLPELIDRFPSVTVMDVDALMWQVRNIMHRVTIAVELVFGFTLLAGLLVLWAAIQATQDERRYDAAILKSIGASHHLLRTAAVVELATLGALAGGIAATGAAAAGYVLARQVFEIAYTPNLRLLLAGIVVSAAFVVVGGYVALRRALVQAPASLLRLGT